MEFDYKGYTKEELRCLCFPEPKKLVAPPAISPHPGGEFYSIGVLLRKFGFFPPFLPLFANYEHGTCYYRKVLKEQINEKTNTYLSYCKWREKLFTPYYKNVKTILFPYIHYRKSKNIKQAKNAKGTLVFVGHSIDKDPVEQAKYIIQKIKNLPDKFKPVCVNMHILDVKDDDFVQAFIDENIPIYTAGNHMDIRYVKRFYNTLKNFKYTLGVTVGSSVIYSVDLGIPFYYIEKDIDLKSGDFKKKMEVFGNGLEGEDIIKYDKARELFNVDILETEPVITPEQKEFVRASVGEADSISRLEASRYFWYEFFRRLFSDKSLSKTFLKYLKRKPLFFLNKPFIKYIIEYIRL